MEYNVINYKLENNIPIPFLKIHYYLKIDYTIFEPFQCFPIE